MTSDPIIIKFHRSKLPTFLKAVKTTVENAIETNDDPSTVLSYATAWNSWINKGLMECKTRHRLQQIILQRNTVPKKETTNETLELVIAKMRELLPVLDEKFNFTHIKDEDIWHMTAKPALSNDNVKEDEEDNKIESKDNNDGSNMEEEEIIGDNDKEKSDWHTPTGKSTFQSKSMEAPQVLDTPTENKFDILEPSTSSENKNDDDGISYATSSKENTPTGSNDDSSDKKNIKVDNAKQEEEYNFSDESENEQDNTLSDKELRIITNAIKNKDVHDVDENILIRWINEKSVNILKTSDDVKTQGSKIRQHLDSKYATLMEKMKETVSTYTKSQVDTSMYRLRDETTQLRLDLSKQCTALRHEINDGKTTTKIWMDENKKKAKQLETSIKRSETDAIMAINTCGNQFIDEINTLKEKGQELVSDMNNIKVTANESKNSAVQAINHLRKEIETLYDRFTEDISETADNERDIFRSWINERKQLINNQKEIFDELNKERELLKAERMLLRTEKELMTKQRLEFDQWANTHKQMFQQMLQKSDFYGPTTKESPINVDDDETPPRTKYNNILPKRKFQFDEAVHYVNGDYNVYGYIMTTDAPYFDLGTWHYAIYTAEGNKISHCEEQYITSVKDSIPSNKTHRRHTHGTSTSYNASYNNSNPPNNEYYEEQTYAPPYEQREQRPWSTSRSMYSSNKPLADTEFIYPIGSKNVKQVHSLQLYKAAQYWTISIANVQDLRGFYERLRGQLQHYNILIRAYDDIKKFEPIATITSENCTNYDNAVKSMSTTLFTMLDQNKSNIFEHYPEPLAYLDSFRPHLDGFEFLKQIMKKCHPHLRDKAVKQSIDVPKPTMSDGVNIFKFINSYIEWLHDEMLRNNRSYTKIEQLNHVLSQLSDEPFEQAKKSIERDIEDLHLNSRNPKPVPSHLEVNARLGLYIVELLPSDKQQSVYDDIASQIQRDTADSPVIRKVRDGKTWNSHTKRDTSWAKDIKWEIMPNEQCPACQRYNHNVYKTGCPQLATFANCQKFMKTIPKDKVDVILEEFNNYQKTLNKSKRQRRNNDRRTIKALAETYDEEDIAQVKKTLFNKYLEDFKDEQYCVENPYESLDNEESLEEE